MNRLAGAALQWLAWWSLLFWLWLAYVGEWDRYEWIAGAGAAAVAATGAAVVHGLGLLRFRPVPSELARAGRVPLQVVLDFGILVLVLGRTLVLRRPVRGILRTRSLDARGRDARSAFRRAFLAAAATYSPNAYVVDADPEAGTVHTHVLVPNEASERPL